MLDLFSHIDGVWRLRSSLLAISLALAGVCCDFPAGPPAAVERAGPVKSRPAGQVTFPSGRVFHVDLALTWADQARGYMGRREILPEEGMLFVYDRPGVRKFWMKNCLTALDIIWLDRDNRVLHIEHQAPPCTADPCPSLGPDEPSMHVLEVAPGAAAAEGLKPGDSLQVVMDRARP